MPILWEIDPTSEDAANVSLVLAEPTYKLTEMDLTPPEVEPIYAASADTEGDPFVGSRHRNRTISLSFIAISSTNALVQTAVYTVQQKVDKLRREGGTLKMTTLAGTTMVGDVLFARFSPEFTPEMYVLNRAVRFKLEFECKPYFRGAPTTLSDHTETTLPVLVFTETSLTGDVPGLGKLVVDDDQGADQFWMVWGIQSRYYDSASSAALFYEAEGRTALGGSATAVGPSGASGGGSNVMRNTALITSYQAILSTQTTGAGAHLSHVGNYRVFARVQTPLTNTGIVTVALQWGDGDFRTFTRNPDHQIPSGWEGSWRLLDLGTVHLTQVAQGTQRWEGRVLAKSTVVGDDIDLDYLLLVPTDEGSGEVSGIVRSGDPTSFSARDEFAQASGALTGNTLPVGGTWVGAGDADDFSLPGIGTGPFARRTAVSDADENTGRYLIAGTATFTNVIIQADVRQDATEGAITGVLARYIDTSNWFMAHLETRVSLGRDDVTLRVRKRVAGTMTEVANVVLSSATTNVWYTIRLQVESSGRWTVWVSTSGGGFTLFAQDTDSVLATGGTLASGKSGFYDAQPNSGAETRDVDNFWVAVPVVDAAVFASQSLEVRHDRVIREDSAGAVWQSPSRYEGDYLRLPPAGLEARTVRVVAKMVRNNPVTGPDSAIDDVSGRITYTPRYLVLPG